MKRYEVFTKQNGCIVEVGKYEKIELAYQIISMKGQSNARKYYIRTIEDTVSNGITGNEAERLLHDITR